MGFGPQTDADLDDSDYDEQGDALVLNSGGDTTSKDRDEECK